MREYIKSYCKKAEDFNYISIFDKTFVVVTDPLMDLMTKEIYDRTHLNPHKGFDEYSSEYKEAERILTVAHDIYEKSCKSNISREDILKLTYMGMSFLRKRDDVAYNEIRRLTNLI